MSLRWMQQAWTDARSAAGVEGVHFHDLRHTAGTLAAQHGATVREAMGHLGHSTPAAAMRYQHPADRRAQELAERLDETVRGLLPDIRPMTGRT